MNKTVREIISEYNLTTFAAEFAIHQTKDECIATFRKYDESGRIKFTGWNEDVSNGTAYHSVDDLLHASVAKVGKIASDWIVLEVFLF